MSGNIGPMLLGIQWSLWIVSTAVMTMRVYVRTTYLKSRLNAADWTMIIALICETVAACFTSVAVHYGLGRHISTLNHHHIMHAILYEYVLSIFNLFAPMFGRLSFSIYLLGILPSQAKAQKISLYVINVVQISSVILTLIQLYAQCGSKVDALWDVTIDWNSYCQPHHVALHIGYVTASLYAVCDLWLTILPILMTRKLKMRRSLKLAVIAVLCLSGIAFLGSVTRVCLLTFLTRPDITWYITYLVLCVVVESNIVIICASTPVLRILWIKDSRGRASRNAGSGDSYDLSHSSKIRANALGKVRHLSAAIPKVSLRKNPTSDGTSEDYILEGTRDLSNSVTAAAEQTLPYLGPNDALDTVITAEPGRGCDGTTSPTAVRLADLNKTTQVQVTYGHTLGPSRERRDELPIPKSWA